MNADESNSRAERVNEAIAEYLEAVDAGRVPDAKAFLAAHSEIATDLQAFLSDRQQFAALAQGIAPPIAEAPTVPPSESSTEIAPLGSLRTVRYFGDYELLEEIARGGMGVVYKARQTSLKRIVALKMILAGQLASEEDVRRFHPADR
jgi:serine/threonine-protein kinase